MEVIIFLTGALLGIYLYEWRRNKRRQKNARIRENGTFLRLLQRSLK